MKGWGVTVTPSLQGLLACVYCYLLAVVLPAPSKPRTGDGKTCRHHKLPGQLPHHRPMTGTSHSHKQGALESMPSTLEDSPQKLRKQSDHSLEYRRGGLQGSRGPKGRTKGSLRGGELLLPSSSVTRKDKGRWGSQMPG